MAEFGPNVLVLAVSVAALAVSLAALLRGAPAQLRDEADTASRIARDARDEVARTVGTWEAFKSDVSAVLEGMETERAAIQRHRAALTAKESRERQAQPPEPQTRDELLAQLRVQAGIFSNGGG